MFIWLIVIGLIVLYALNKLFEFPSDYADSIMAGRMVKDAKRVEFNRLRSTAGSWFEYAYLRGKIAKIHKKEPFRDYDEFLKSRNFERINFYDYIDLCHCRDGKIIRSFKLAVRFKQDGTPAKWLVYAEKDGKTYLIEDLKKYNLFECVTKISMDKFLPFYELNLWLRYVNNGLITPEVPFHKIVEYYEEHFARDDECFHINGDRWLKYCRMERKKQFPR
jgi:hypothetical protein